MYFHKFATFLQKLESTAGRNEMTENLAEFLPLLKGEEIAQALYLMMGRLVPKYENVEFNVSRKLALRALESEELKIKPGLPAGRNGGLRDMKSVNALFKELGDAGLVAERLLGDKKTSDLSISKVYSALWAIAKLEGKGSQERKMKGYVELLQRLDPLSARYVTRVIIGNLRLGLSDKTIQDALSWAVVGDKSLRLEIERAFGAKADIGELAKIILETDLTKENARELVIEKLLAVKLTPGVPVASKLVEREKTAGAIFKRLKKHIAQPKLDGLRAQIHFDGTVAEVFSRDMKSLTDSFPDLISAAQKLGVKSIILDSEAIGYDTENDTYLPFQETMQRRRKYDVSEMAESIPVKAMAFDLLYLDGEDCSRKPLEERMEKLKKVISGSSQKVIDMLDSPLMNSEEELEEYFSEKVGEGLEGVIVKKLGTPYEPGTRNFDWIKLKANTRSDLVDTIDTVVLGYYTGRGVRAKFGVGALLVGLYDEKDGKYYSVAKVGTGMKDDDWKNIKQDLTSLEVQDQPSNVVVEKLLHPDVWVRPEIVMEIDADEITRSPSHTAAKKMKADFEKDTQGKGLSLRFPRMKVWRRDKNPEQATSVRELVRMYQLRKGV